jgi:hypothetical protein
VNAERRLAGKVAVIIGALFEQVDRVDVLVLNASGGSVGSASSWSPTT